MWNGFICPDHLRPSDPRFGVGPSLIPQETVQKLLETNSQYLGRGHRKNPVKKIIADIQQGLQDYFRLPQGYQVVLGNGGATFLWDMIGLGAVLNSSAHFICGEFSEKWWKAHENIPWIKTQSFKAPLGQGIIPYEVHGSDLLCCTLNETSTGVQCTNLPELKNSQTLLALDATSGAGQMKVDFSKVDFYYFSVQKIFASEGGLYVAILSPKAQDRVEKMTDRYIPVCMKWSHALENAKKNQTYNTPSLSTLFFLNEQIKKMNVLGEEKIIEEARKKAKWVYQWANKKDYLKPFVEDETFRSQSVATINVDERIKVDELVRWLDKEKIAFDISGYRKLKLNQLRISLFHNIKLENLQKLTTIISMMIEHQG